MTFLLSRPFRINFLASLIVSAGAVSTGAEDQFTERALADFGEYGGAHGSELALQDADAFEDQQSSFCGRDGRQGWAITMPFFRWKYSSEAFVKDKAMKVQKLVQELKLLLDRKQKMVVEIDYAHAALKKDLPKREWKLSTQPPEPRNHSHQPYQQREATLRDRSSDRSIRMTYASGNMMVNLSEAEYAERVRFEEDMQLSYMNGGPGFDVNVPRSEMRWVSDDFYTVISGPSDILQDRAGTPADDPAGPAAPAGSDPAGPGPGPCLVFSPHFGLRISGCADGFYCIRCPPFTKDVLKEKVQRSDIESLNEYLLKIKRYAHDFGQCKDMMDDEIGKSRIKASLRVELVTLMNTLKEGKAICEKWTDVLKKRNLLDQFRISNFFRSGTELKDCSSLEIGGRQVVSAHI